MKKFSKNKNIFKLIGQIYYVLNRKRKFQLLIVLILMIFSGLSEMLTIAALYPYINLINNPKNGLEAKYLKDIIKIFNIETAQELIYVITFLFILIISVTSIIRLLNLTLNFRIAALLGNELGTIAYKNILSKDYIYHKNINTSNLIAALTTKTNFTIRVIRSFLQLTTSIIVLLFIVGFTLFIDTKITIILGVSISIIYFLISSFTRKILYKNSESVAFKTNQVIKSIQEGFGSIREILLYRIQDPYINSFSRNDLRLRLSIANSDTIGFFPRFILEGASIIILCLIGILVFSQNQENESTIPLLATFALASQKILPAAQFVYSSFSEIIAHSQSAKDVLKMIEGKNKYQIFSESFPIPKLSKIEFLNVYFRYDKNQDYIIKNLSLTINQGEYIGLIGETGSGKTTFIDLMMGLLKPTKGKILVNGKDINSTNETINSWRESISHVPQNIYLLDSSIKDNIIFGDLKNDIKSFNFAIKISKLEDFINNLRYGLMTTIGERGAKLSGGQKQRIGIARAFYKNKPLMIFDEATSSLDEKTEKKIFMEINKFRSQKTLFMITHRLSTLKNLDRVLLLKRGKIVLDKNSNQIDFKKEIYSLIENN